MAVVDASVLDAGRARRVAVAPAAALAALTAALAASLLLGGCVAGASPSSGASTGLGTATPSPSVTASTSASPAAATSWAPSPSGAASPSSAVAPTAAPDLAEVVCATDPLTSLSTPIVRPRPDGVHIRTANRTGRDLALDVKDVGGDNAPVGVSETTWQVGPGTMRIRCLDPEVDAGSDAGRVSLAVVDPESVFRPTALSCSSATTLNNDYVEGAAGQKGDPVALTRAAISGLRTGDRVEAAGYPQAPERLVRVVRDGDVLAWLGWDKAEDGGWLLSTASFCGATGLGMRPTE